jgi:hypothetical protein
MPADLVEAHMRLCFVYVRGLITQAEFAEAYDSLVGGSPLAAPAARVALIPRGWRGASYAGC